MMRNGFIRQVSCFAASQARSGRFSVRVSDRSGITISDLLSAGRRRRLVAAARQRLSGVSFAFENLYDAHNGAAGIRSIEALGFGHIYWLGESRISAHVSRGATRWVEVDRLAGAADLRALCTARGQQLWVSALAADTANLCDWTPEVGPTCFAFGNEHSGVSDELRALADRCYTIPMYGLVQSYNLSVAVALTAWEVHHRLTASDASWWKMDEGAVTALLAKWGVE